jgi:hypothetical protein
MRSEPPDVSELDRSLPRALDSVLRRALAKDPGDRHASCAEFAADLEAATGSRRRRRTSSSRLAVRVRRSRVRRRWLRPALIGAATGAALGAAVVGAVHGGAGGDARTVTVVRRPALAAAEQALAGLVPAALRRSCEHAPPTLDFDASVSCRAGAGTRVQYSHAVSGARMRAQLLADAVTHGVAMFGAPVSPVGRCGQTPTGIRDWAFVTTGNRAQITRPGAGPALGRLLCYVSSNGWSALEWTDTRVDVLTEAYRTAPTGLYTWWTRHGGPQAQ